MIARDYVTAWRTTAPWVTDHQVEHDLVLSRALVGIFSVAALGQRLAFRGGTALYKLHLRPAARYSEDLDLVQVVPEPIGETFDAVRGVLDPWLGEPRRVLKEGRVNLVYRLLSDDEPPRPLRIKIEINSREHFTELGYLHLPFAVSSEWWSGNAEITTFELDELLGTKPRALYQRRKGRDLFDLWYGLVHGRASARRVITCFRRYLEESGHRVSRVEFEENLARKLDDVQFCADLTGLLHRSITWSIVDAASLVRQQLLAELE